MDQKDRPRHLWIVPPSPNCKHLATDHCTHRAEEPTRKWNRWLRQWAKLWSASKKNQQ